MAVVSSSIVPVRGPVEELIVPVNDQGHALPERSLFAKFLQISRTDVNTPVRFVKVDWDDAVRILVRQSAKGS